MRAPLPSMSVNQQDYPRDSFGLSLVAFYGTKPSQLVDYLLWCQELLCAEVSVGFKPYEIDQIHATIVGIEGRYVAGQPANENFLQLGLIRPMNLPGAIKFLHHASEIPFQCRLGGFRRGQEYGFRSFGRHPFERSFEIQDSGTVLVLGWPFVGETVSKALFTLRQRLKSFNILHKYHMTQTEEDNDCYFVLGKVDIDSVNPSGYESASRTIRGKIAASKPTLLTIDRDCLSFVCYTDRRLPTSSSVRIPLQQSGSLLDPYSPLVGTASTLR
jgi:hypothetical protein